MMAEAATDVAVIRPSCVAELAEVAAPLMREHWLEVEEDRELAVLSPDWARYRVMERAGVLVPLVAWKAGLMVGYSISFILLHLHYSTLCYAQNDAVFITKTARRSRLGAQLIAATEGAVRERGARLLLWHAVPGSTLEVLLHRGGYVTKEVQLGRRL